MVCLEQDIRIIQDLYLSQTPSDTPRTRNILKSSRNEIRHDNIEAASTTSALLWGEKATEAYPLLVPFLKIRYNLHQLMVGVS